jgi:hypothetical protein
MQANPIIFENRQEIFSGMRLIPTANAWKDGQLEYYSTIASFSPEYLTQNYHKLIEKYAELEPTTK